MNILKKATAILFGALLGAVLYATAARLGFAQTPLAAIALMCGLVSLAFI